MRVGPTGPCPNPARTRPTTRDLGTKTPSLPHPSPSTDSTSWAKNQFLAHLSSPSLPPMLGSFRVRVPELSPCRCCHHPKDVAVRHAGTPTHPCHPFTMELSFLSLLLPLSHPTITPQRPPAALPRADGCTGGTVNPPERPRSAAGTAAHARNDAVPAPHPLFVFRVLHDPSEPSPALECRSAVDYKMARCKRCI